MFFSLFYYSILYSGAEIYIPKFESKTCRLGFVVGTAPWEALLCCSLYSNSPCEVSVKYFSVKLFVSHCGKSMLKYKYWANRKVLVHQMAGQVLATLLHRWPSVLLINQAILRVMISKIAVPNKEKKVWQ